VTAVATSSFRQPADLTDRAGADFASAFGRAPDGVWAAPGRVNLIGEHTDYNGGLCLPVALAHRTYVALATRADDGVRVRSRQRDQVWRGRVGEVGSGWTAYVTGVLWALRAAGVPVSGVDVHVDSAVPVGAGLSSSAALTCAVAVAVAERSGTNLSRTELAASCVRAENEAVGAPTGGMDQTVALLARAGSALLLDCRDWSTEHLQLNPAAAGLQLLVIDTRAAHSLADGQYAQRRADCEAAAASLGVSSLREVAEADLRQLSDPRLLARARHVVTEIARVREVASLLRTGRLGETGPLLDASHTSLRDDFAVSCLELDIAVGAAREAGALGARMTGGGFGGSVLALIRAGTAGAVAHTVASAFASRRLVAPAFLLAEPSDGATRMR